MKRILKPKRDLKKFSELSENYKVIAKKESIRIGFKESEIVHLEFEIKEGVCTSIVDRGAKIKK